MTDTVIESGRIVSVSSELFGDELAADATTGDTVLHVLDAGDFDELEGGTLQLNGEIIDYIAVDNDADTLTLATGISADAAAGDRVYVWDAITLAVAREVTAYVMPPGKQANADPLPAKVLQALAPQLADGNREDDKGESVTIQLVGTQWTVIDVVGKEPAVTAAFGAVQASAFAYTSTPQALSADIPLDSIDMGQGPAARYFELSAGEIHMLKPGWYSLGVLVEFLGVTAGDDLHLRLSFNTTSDNEKWAHVPSGLTDLGLSTAQIPFYVDDESHGYMSITAEQYGGSGATVTAEINIVRLSG